MLGKQSVWKGCSSSILPLLICCGIHERCNGLRAAHSQSASYFLYRFHFVWGLFPSVCHIVPFIAETYLLVAASKHRLILLYWVFTGRATTSIWLVKVVFPSFIGQRKIANRSTAWWPCCSNSTGAQQLEMSWSGTNHFLVGSCVVMITSDAYIRYMHTQNTLHTLTHTIPYVNTHCLYRRWCR